MAVFQEPTQWGHELGNNADVSTLPDDTGATTGVASLQKLFQIINQTPLEAGGVAPDREDFNALFKILGDSVFYGMNGGLASYNPDYDYVVGRYVVYNNTLYKCIQANGTSSTVVAPDSVTPSGSDYWKDIENQETTSLIPNQIIQSPVPLTDVNLHLLDGALLSGSGAYADYVAMMAALYNADPTAACWTTENAWQASVTAYGECGKFVYDSVNNTVRLPKLTSFIQATSTASELGNLVEAGLPNITGYFEPNQDNIQGTYTGAFFYESGTFTGGIGIHGGGSSSTTGKVNIDASRSSSIYGNSTTVQPQSIKYYFYIVVGTVSKTDIQIDIDNVMTDLALKADKDLSNVPNSKGILVESYVNGASWYRKYSDGWCEQGGTYDNGSLAIDWTADITMLVAFSNTNYQINCQAYRLNNVTGAVNNQVFGINKTSSTFKVRAYGDGGSQYIDWCACGYIS